MDFVVADGKVTKKTYEDGLKRLLAEKDDVEYEEPVLGTTQALGLQANLLSRLPSLYLLPAISDYSDEIDQRTSSTVFRRLMGELANRLLKQDPRFGQIETALATIRQLFNETKHVEGQPAPHERLQILGEIENSIKGHVAKLMPSVTRICLSVLLAETSEFFSKGVALKVDDGVLNDVLDKGHGLQRAIIFSLLQALIKSDAGKLVPGQEALPGSVSSIILAIEEPELYVHPQLQRLIFGVLKEFSATDQVIYCTHSPAFVDVWSYCEIGVVRKESVAAGTQVRQCPVGVLGTEADRKGFQLLNSFNLETNRLFFAQRVVLVEGDQDQYALVAAGREQCLFTEFPEEIGFSIIIAGSKGEIPKFQKLLNAFQIPYIVLHEMDGRPDADPENKAIIDLLGANGRIELPDKLETLVGYPGHFPNCFSAKQFFSNPANLNGPLKTKCVELFTV